MSCASIQERLDELVLGGGFARPGDWEPALREHAASCPACAAHVRFLGSLAHALDAEPAPALHPAALARVRERAARTLRAGVRPRGLARELAAALALSLVALPVVVGHAWLVAEGASALLAPWLPGVLLSWLEFVYFGSMALAVGALYAGVPLWVAWARRGSAEAEAT